MIRNNFSQRVQMVIQLSREEAIRMGHDYIGTEHLLLGLIRSGEGVAIEILQALDGDLDELKKAALFGPNVVGTTMDTEYIGGNKLYIKTMEIEFMRFD